MAPPGGKEELMERSQRPYSIYTRRTKRKNQHRFYVRFRGDGMKRRPLTPQTLHTSAGITLIFYCFPGPAGFSVCSCAAVGPTSS